jgi:hypothetical protein
MSEQKKKRKPSTKKNTPKRAVKKPVVTRAAKPTKALKELMASEPLTEVVEAVIDPRIVEKKASEEEVKSKGNECKCGDCRCGQPHLVLQSPPVEPVVQEKTGFFKRVFSFFK